jgi:hypothetical protein
MALRLYDARRSSGALNLYSTRVGVFDDAGEVGSLFAHQAGLAVAYAEQVTTLAEAVKTRTVIGQAVGIVMERYDMNDEHAFAYLKRVSSHGNVKLGLVAEELVASSRVNTAAPDAS